MERTDDDHKPSVSSPEVASRGSSSMSQDDPVCGRHSFAYKVIRRDVTTDDRIRDKGNRRSNKLWWEPRGYDEHLEPDRTYSTYTQRYPVERDDPVEEENLGSEPVDPYEEPEPEDQMDGYRSDYSSNEMDRFNPREDDERIREKLQVEADLVQHSKGKLDPKMIDLVPDGQTMSKEKRRIHKDICEVLVNEMADVTSRLGKIVQEIASFGIPGREQEYKHREKELQDLFVRFANIIAVRFLRSDSCSEETAVGQDGLVKIEIFRSLGSSYMYSDDFEGSIPPLSGKFNTRIDVLGDEGTSTAFGEVKATLASELKDRLIGQILRYLWESFRHGSIAGTNYFFTLCGPSLRLWYADASAYGSSAAYSFAKKNDYAKIVDIIAFLCGPVELIYNRWMLEEGGTLEIRNETNQIRQFTIKDVKRLFTNGQIWGSRTVVWAANIEAQSDGALEMPTERDLQLIIKSAWLERDLVRHELDVLEWIQRKVKPEPGSVETKHNIPIPIGHVLGTSSQPLKLKEWATFDGQKLNSTIATFSIRATRIPHDIDIHQLWAVARSLLETLRFLHRAGIHYRDLHSGNILMTEAPGPQRCVLVDFGNARILRARKGYLSDIDHQPDGWTVNKEDSHSGNNHFMSRRIHALSEDMKKLGQLERGLPDLRRQWQDDPEFIAAQETDIANLRESLENSAYSHRYVDDWESALYWLLFQANAGKKPGEVPENCLTQILHINVKKNLWSDPAVFRAATCVVKPYSKAAVSWRALVDSCQKELESPPSQNDPDRPAAVMETGPDPKEMACFDKIIQVVLEAELQFAPKELDLMALAGPSKKRAYPDQPHDDPNKRPKLFEAGRSQ